MKHKEFEQSVMEICALEGYSVIDEWRYNYDHAEIIYSLDKRKFDLRMS